MRSINVAAVLGAVLALGACGNFDAPNQNSSTLQDLTQGTPSRAGVATAVQGLFLNIRGSNIALGGGQFGREAWSLDVSNPQAVPPVFAVNNQSQTGTWTNAYQGIRQANIIIAALAAEASDPIAGMTAGEKEAVIGFCQTVKAYLLFTVIRTTYTGGAVLEPPSDLTAAPSPVVDQPTTYARILGLLDSAATHLNTAIGAGAGMPFTMTAGFSPFNTPTTFLQFNKGVRAKVNLTNANYAAALTDLGGSFLNTGNPMTTGAYSTYSTNSGDALNPYYDPTARQRYAHTSFATDAKLQAGAVAGDTTKRDLRFLTKISRLGAFTSLDVIARYGFTVYWAFSRYPSNTTPVPVLRNEELILIRAEANIANSSAIGATPQADIDVVRAVAGLPPISPIWGTLTATQQRDSLLYEKRYSLMYENGDRWVDLRRYGLLATLPKDRTGDLIFPNQKIPVNECNPRAVKPAGCTQLPGL